MARVEFRHVNKIFPNGTQALTDLNLEIDDGQLMVLVGPSGCGKSTALRVLAGLEDITSGEILVDGEIINDKAPQLRNIAMVFQNYALYPHMTIKRNLEFPLKMMKLGKQEIEARVTEAAGLLSLTELLDRKPKELSGGQRQRVAMGRAIVRDPAVFLMDEPLSNLDATLRIRIRSEIAALQKRMGTTTLYVTHDQVEAMTLGDTVAVVNEGKLQQVATPQELYDNPANVFVAGFIGNPGTNIVESRLRRDADGNLSIDFGEQSLPVHPCAFTHHEQLERHIDSPLFVGLRPEAFSLEEGSTEFRDICVTVRSVEPLGHETLVYCDAPGTMRNSKSKDKASTMTLIARLSGNRPIKPGIRLTLKIDLRKLYFFDQNGWNIKN